MSKGLAAKCFNETPHTFTDYFQMSKGLAAKCHDEFASTRKQLCYDEEYSQQSRPEHDYYMSTQGAAPCQQNVWFV
jgi:hypothetical protein